MLIPIRQNESSKVEWSILELQGSLAGYKKINGLKLGKLQIMEQVITLHIGTHVLQGKVEVLTEPFAVLKKNQDDSNNPSYRIIGFVKKKLIFNSRPQPVITLNSS